MCGRLHSTEPQPESFGPTPCFVVLEVLLRTIYLALRGQSWHNCFILGANCVPDQPHDTESRSLARIMLPYLSCLSTLLRRWLT